MPMSEAEYQAEIRALKSEKNESRVVGLCAGG